MSGAEDAVFKEAWRTLEDAEEKGLEKAEEVWERTVEGSHVVKKELSAHSHGHRRRSVEPPSDYTGPRVHSPFTLELALQMLEAFKDNTKMHAMYVQSVLHAAKKRLKGTGNPVNSVRVPSEGRVIVVGDVHGQLTDLATIFERYGMPGPQNVFVFNGDFVDRGPQGMEIILVLLVLYMADPASTILNRGNHEQRHINERYDFHEQVTTQYSEDLYEMAEKVFKYLPLVTLINDVVFVVHGGISPASSFTLDAVRSLPQINPHNSKNPSADTIKKLLWSDPSDNEGWTESTRGTGVEWGPDITKQFLERNNLAMIVRSHQVKDEGFEFKHNGRVLTIFSASNYCGLSENKAAVAIFEGAKWDSLEHALTASPAIESFYALAFLNTSAREQCKIETLQMLRKHIFMARHHLVEAFTESDKEHKGIVNVDTFINVMAQVLGLEINWKVLWPYFAKANNEGYINYTNVLSRYKVTVEGSFSAEFLKSIVHKICQKIVQANTTLYSAWLEMDLNKDGGLSYTEFVAAMNKFGLGLTVEQIYDIFNAIDANHNGYIEYDEFQKTFKKKLEGVRMSTQTDKDREWVQEQLYALAHILMSRGESFDDVFDQIDVGKSGEVSASEFESGLRELGLSYTSDQAKSLIKGINSTASEASIFLKKSAFRTTLGYAKMELLESEQGGEFMTSMVHNIARGLHTHSIQLARLFRQMDVDGTGILTQEEFRVGLHALNAVLDIPLSDDQLEALHRLLDTNHDGGVSYEEFINGFSFE